MQLVAGFNAIESASALVCFAAGMIIGSISTTKALSHLSCKRVTQLGFVLVSVGILLMFLASRSKVLQRGSMFHCSFLALGAALSLPNHLWW